MFYAERDFRDTIKLPVQLARDRASCPSQLDCASFVEDDRARDEDDLGREVYGILGIPIDAVDVLGVLGRIESASAAGDRFLISTPNLNFLVSSQIDSEFRESLLTSDLCPVDGVPIVWIAKLLGVPIKHRVAGSDIFEALRSRVYPSRPSKVFLFGGPEGVAHAASEVLNANADGVVCVGVFYPGYCSIEEMSSDHIIQSINSSGADFLILSLGARKGQAWLMRNHDRLRVPVRSHLGAAINFQAGTLKRAPRLVRKLGFEWLWRIKEEPYLWRRYGHDGVVLLKLLATKVLPLAIGNVSARLSAAGQGSLSVRSTSNGKATTVHLTGDATAPNIRAAIAVFRDALGSNEAVWIDASGVKQVDARFFGLFLMIRKRLGQRGTHLRFTGISTHCRRAFRLHGFEFLLQECP